MASKRGDTFDKRQRERRRQEKNAIKRARKEGREVPGPVVHNRPPVASASSAREAELMQMFAVLNEHYNAGGIDKAVFEARRKEIFAELGMETHDDDASTDTDDTGDTDDTAKAGEDAA